MMYPFAGFMGGFGFLFMVLFWGLVVWGVVVFARGGFSGPNNPLIQNRKAIDILKERYARGEIEKKEFEEKKKALEE